MSNTNEAMEKGISNVTDLLIYLCLTLCLLVTTVLGNAAAVWTTGRGASQPFTVHAVINYPTQYGILYPFHQLFESIMHLCCITLWAVTVNGTVG